MREYEDDTNLRATLVLDASGSMDFASAEVSKLHYAVRLAAALAYLAEAVRLSRIEQRRGRVAVAASVAAIAAWLTFSPWFADQHERSAYTAGLNDAESARSEERIAELAALEASPVLSLEQRANRAVLLALQHRHTEAFLGDGEHESARLPALRRAVDAALASVPRPPVLELVGVAGTVVTLAALHLGHRTWDLPALEGHRIPRAWLDTFVARTLPLDPAAADLPGRRPMRSRAT